MKHSDVYELADISSRTMKNQAQRENPIYVNLDSAVEVELMGNLISEINVENDTGEDVSVIYYKSGISKFDELLENKPFYEYGLTFHICSYENAIAFVLYHPKKKIFADKVAFWRDSILNGGQHKEKYLGDFVSQSYLLNAVKSGIAGSGAGLIGTTISIAGGTIISRLRGIKTKELPAVVYQFEFAGDNCILSYSKKENEFKVGNFLSAHFKNELEIDTIKNNDSRCFIATECYGTLETVQLMTFRNFRDRYLSNYTLGRLFIKCYYLCSPILIKHLNDRSKKFIKRRVLDKIFLQLYKRKYYGE